MLFEKEKPYGVYINSSIKKKGVVKADRKMIIAVIGGITAVIVAVLMLFSTLVGRPGAEHDVDVFGARLSVMVNLTNEAKKSIKDREINQINTNARLTFTTDRNNINAILQDTYGKEGISNSAISLATNANVSERLTEAKLLNKYDVQYRAILEQYIADAIQAGLQAKSASRSRSADQTIQTAIDNLRSVRKQLQDSRL